MKKLLLLVSALVVLMACNKDKFQSTPQIKIKSVSTDFVDFTQGLTVVLSFTDKEGDVSDSVFIRKVRLNKRFTTTLRDTIGFKIPDFPSHSTGDIEVTLNNDNVKSANPPLSAPGGGKEPDSLNIWYKVKDKAGHMSDSVSTGLIVVRQS